ncbi:MAG TPA: hypothetical protein GYA08_12205, partial [Chloroflexi bacterium]|nr:hypothetical protein [Chloroflexota bacterium]
WREASVGREANAAASGVYGEGAVWCSCGCEPQVSVGEKPRLEEKPTPLRAASTVKGGVYREGRL